MNIQLEQQVIEFINNLTIETYINMLKKKLWNLARFYRVGFY